MSRTVKKSKGYGYDYWSRRCFGDCCRSYGPIAKWITKMQERMRDKTIVRKALDDPYEEEISYEGRFPGE